MRFLLYFPLPLLLILGSFVSIDAAPQSVFKPVPPWSTHKQRLKRSIDNDSFVSIDAAPQSVFKPVPPWSTHKQRLKRSIDDSTSTADYDGLSLDQLTKLLEEKKKDLDFANKSLIAKQAEYDKAKEDYDKKKEEWDKFKEFNYWRNKSAEAKKIIDAIDIPPLQEKYLESERYFLEAETMYITRKEELEDINGFSEGKDVEKNLKDESTRLTQEIATQASTVTSMEGIKKTKETALSNLKDDEKYYNRDYAKDKCNEPEKATVTPCSDTIAELGKIKSKMQTAEDEAATAIQNHKVAVDKKKELESQMTRIGDRLDKLGRDKTNIPRKKETAEDNLEDAESNKDRKQKQYFEAKTALETAKAELAKALAAKTEADPNLNPDTEAKESEANTAQDKAGKEKTRLEGELAGLKADKDEKEKIWNATSTKVAELQQRTDEKGAVSTGGGNLAFIIGPIAAIIVVCLIVGVALFVFFKKRKSLAKEKGPKKEAQKESLLGGVAEEPIGKVATETKSASKVEIQPVPPVGTAVCPDVVQLPQLTQEDIDQMEINDTHDTRRADKPPKAIVSLVLFKDLPPEVLPKARALIKKMIKNWRKTKITIFKHGAVLFKIKDTPNFKGGFMHVTFDGHDSKECFDAKSFAHCDIEEAYKFVDRSMPLSQPLSSADLIQPCRKRFIAIPFRSTTIPCLAKYEEMEREEASRRERQGRERGPAGQDDLPTARLPVSEQNDITEKTQKSVSGTQVEECKEDGEAVVRIPDDKSMVTGTLKEEGKPEIDMSLVEKTTREPSCREPLQECTGISGPEPPHVAGRRRRDSRASQVSDSKEKGPRKREKEWKKGWWYKFKTARDNFLMKIASSSSSSRSLYDTLHELTRRLGKDADARANTSASTGLPPFTQAELRKLQFVFTRRKMDKEELNEAEGVIYQILDQIGPMLKEETRVVEVETPASVVTDIHGNLEVLLTIFATFHTPYELGWSYHRFIFTGDYVDRGENSLQVLLILFVLKLNYPDNIVLLRGNHEDPKCNITYGFYQELLRLFGKEIFDERGGSYMVESDRSKLMKTKINDVYARMPLAARIDKKIFICHGSVPDYDGDLIAAINALPNVMYDPRSDPLACELLWNDCGRGLHGTETNLLRGGIGKRIGADRVEEICKRNGIEKIVNGHQCVSVGFESFAGGLLMVVFSSAKYAKNFDNHGAVIDFTKDGYGIRSFHNIDSLSRKASPRKIYRFFVRFYSKNWLGSDIKTSEQNKEMEKIMLEKSKGKDASRVEQADKKMSQKAKENQVQDENVKKKASQLEQADNSEKPVFSLTMAPT